MVINSSYLHYTDNSHLDYFHPESYDHEPRFEVIRNTFFMISMSTHKLDLFPHTYIVCFIKLPNTN